MAILETPRLILREWQDRDRAPFSALTSDPVVMEFFPALLSISESDAMVDRIQAHFKVHGFGLFAAELRGSGQFIGFIGLVRPSFEAHFTPCVEIGWRLAAQFWNRGLATEGAVACMRFAFDDLKLNQVVAVTVPANQRSRRVMEKLGMTCNPTDNFDHPRIAEGHPLRPHVLYRKSADR